LAFAPLKERTASHPPPLMSASPPRLDGSPPRSAWKYAWSSDAAFSAPSTGRPFSSRAGSKASDRLYHEAKSGRQAREAMQRSLRSEPASVESDPRIPHPNKRSARLAADRYDKVMAHTVTGRYRKAALAIAKAKGEDASLSRDVYNYGDMLFQEARMTQARRDEWRKHELRAKQEAETAESTFHPQLSTASTAAPPAAGGGDGVRERELLERIERQSVERQEKAAQLRQVVMREEERDLTFKPQVRSSAVTRKLTKGYGDVLSEMEKRDAEREMRVRALRERDEAAQRAHHTHRPNASSSTTGGGGGDEASERLYSTYTSSFQQSLLPPATGDRECTFQPNAKGDAKGAAESTTQRGKTGAIKRDSHCSNALV
jgi:hypothetical protein